MTCTTQNSSIEDKVCEEYRASLKSLYTKPEYTFEVKQLTIQDLIKELSIAEVNLDKLKNVDMVVPNDTKSLSKYYNDYINGELASYNKIITDIEVKIKLSRGEIEDEHANKIAEANSIYETKFKELKSKFNPIYDSFNKIKNNKTNIDNFISSTNMIKRDVSVDFKSMGIDDLIKLSKTAEYVLNNIVAGKKGLSFLTILLYLPIVIDISDDTETNIYFKYIYAVILIALIALFYPYSLGIIGILVVTHALFSLINQSSIENLLNIILNVAYSNDLDNFINDQLEKEEEIIKLNDNVLELENMDLDSLIESKLSSLNKSLKEAKAKSPESVLREELKTKLSESSQAKLLSDLKVIFYEEEIILDRLIESYSKYVNLLFDMLKAYKDNVSYPGMIVPNNPLMNTKFKTGAIYYKKDLVHLYDVDIPFENIMFKYASKDMLQPMINLVKLFICNVIGSVHGCNCEITIIDVDGLGNSFKELLSIPLKQYINVASKDLPKEIEKLYDAFDVNSSKQGSELIQDYNKRRLAEDSVTLNYKVAIIIATKTHNLWSNKKFIEFKNYSTESGVWIWCVHPDRNCFMDKDRKLPDGINDLFTFPVVFSDTSKFMYKDQLQQIYNEEKLEYTVEDGKKVSKVIEAFILKPPELSIPYEEKFRQRHIPDSKIWTFDTHKGIDIMFGFYEGDPAETLPQKLCDEPVHMLMAGDSGSGKSVTINQMLASLLYMYPPSLLELVMIDFKNAEFAMYADVDTGASLIPHASVLAGTKDGEYAVSIFNYVYMEMKRRQKLFAGKVQNIGDWNAAIKAGTIKGEILPRILVLCDEFQEMFVGMDNKFIERIKELLTSLSKLARFCGAHLWFTSQSMKGTVSDDVLNQFGLRAVLKCGEETSTTVLGNKVGATIRSIGWVWTNDKKGNPDDNKLYRIPFIDNKEAKKYILKLSKLCIEKGEKNRRAVFYDEDRLHYINELKTLYETDNEIRADERVFILGERTEFSLNSLPCHTKLSKDDGENMLILASEPLSKYNLAIMFLENLMFKKCAIIVNCIDAEMASIVNVKKYTKSVVHNWITCKDQKWMLNEIEKSVILREKNPDVPKPPIYFIFMTIDKLNGLGIGDNYAGSDMLKNLLQRAPAVDIHIVLFLRIIKGSTMYLPFINHVIASKCDPDTSQELFNSARASKMSQDFAIHKYGSEDTQKFKIYQADIDKSKLVSREIMRNKQGGVV